MAATLLTPEEARRERLSRRAVILDFIARRLDLTDAESVKAALVSAFEAGYDRGFHDSRKRNAAAYATTLEEPA
jgi:hypothetical protein